ncbi:MAG: Lrp/AsnC ligand binding domain-containing protein [Bacteroidota bacterium]
MQAYILIEAQGGKAKKVFQKIESLRGVKAAHVVTGPYDIIVLAEGKDISEIGEFVLSRIRSIDGVEKTLTCVIVDM